MLDCGQCANLAFARVEKARQIAGFLFWLLSYLLAQFIEPAHIRFHLGQLLSHLRVFGVVHNLDNAVDAFEASERDWCVGGHAASCSTCRIKPSMSHGQPSRAL